nr:hypothetical protein [Rhodopirellula sp. SM50]
MVSSTCVGQVDRRKVAIRLRVFGWTILRMFTSFLSRIGADTDAD